MTKEKQTRNRLVSGCTLGMCKGLPNVTVNDTMVTCTPSEAVLDLLFNAARTWTDWQFDLKDIVTIAVSKDSESLATVSYKYVSRSGENCLSLANDRVSEAMPRTQEYNTPHPAAMIRKMKEYVYPKTLAEVSEPHFSRTEVAAWYPLSTLNTEISRSERELKDVVDEFMGTPEGMAALSAYATKVGKGGEVQSALVRLNEDNALRAYATRAEKDNDAFAICTRHAKGWYVKHKGTVSVYADDELPDSLININTLKLVQAQTVVLNVGMRVNDNGYFVEVV